MDTVSELKQQYDQNLACCRIITGRGRIRRGATVVQDWKSYAWPNCASPDADPDIIFDVYWTGGYWICKAFGYGMLTHEIYEAYGSQVPKGNAYGNGYLMIADFDAITLEVEEQ